METLIINRQFQANGYTFSSVIGGRDFSMRVIFEEGAEHDQTFINRAIESLMNTYALYVHTDDIAKVDDIFLKGGTRDVLAEHQIDIADLPNIHTDIPFEIVDKTPE